MHWADIIAALKKSDCSLTGIALMEGVSVNTVSDVVRNKKTSHPIAYAIAAKTGIPTERMWPGKYLTPAAYQDARGNNRSGRLPTKVAANG